MASKKDLCSYFNVVSEKKSNSEIPVPASVPEIIISASNDIVSLKSIVRQGKLFVGENHSLGKNFIRENFRWGKLFVTCTKFRHFSPTKFSPSKVRQFKRKRSAVLIIDIFYGGLSWLQKQRALWKDKIGAIF